jgi:hypothetical protein
MSCYVVRGSSSRGRTLSPRVGAVAAPVVVVRSSRHHWGVATPTTTTARRPRRRLDPKLLAASLAIAVGLVLIGVALVQSVTGEEAADLPAAIESVTPVPAAVQVPQQSQVIVDLESGYEGRLVVDDVALDTVRLDELVSIDVEPGEQVDVPPGAVFEPGNATLTYTPADGAPVERFTPGSHLVRVIYWLSEEGPARARSYSWSFVAV